MVGGADVECGWAPVVLNPASYRHPVTTCSGAGACSGGVFRDVGGGLSVVPMAKVGRSAIVGRQVLRKRSALRRLLYIGAAAALTLAHAQSANASVTAEPRTQRSPGDLRARCQVRDTPWRLPPRGTVRSSRSGVPREPTHRASSRCTSRRRSGGLPDHRYRGRGPALQPPPAATGGSTRLAAATRAVRVHSSIRCSRCSQGKIIGSR